MSMYVHVPLGTLGHSAWVLFHTYFIREMVVEMSHILGLK